MEHSKPSIKDLGLDLLSLSRVQLIVTLTVPFLFFGLYFLFASLSWWPLAVLCAMAISFTTYGSTSHDLVHENLRLNKKVNTFVLSIMELICFRSGHAYKLSHLHHHRRFPHDDDVEGAASKMSLFRTLIEGFIFQAKIYYWAIKHHQQHRYYKLVLTEGVLVSSLIVFCSFSLMFSNVYFIYMCLMIAGSWIIPLVTSYLVHTPYGHDELHQTRLFRGSFFSIIAFNHLFHLEHHLYPMVPHKNWTKLAKRLDVYFESKGVRPMQVKL